MKTLEINIGLSSKELGVINPETALNELRVQGFEIIVYRLQESTCEDGAETCLVARVGLPEDWQTGLAFIADKLGQECIAVAGFIGADPYESFDPSLWVTPEAKPERTVNGWTLSQFKDYLRDVIIPDSQQSGFTGYAEDLETALQFLS